MLVQPSVLLLSSEASSFGKWLPIVYILPVIASLFLIIGGLRALFGKKRICICGKPAYDVLTSDRTIGYFCRQHLLEKYSELFIGSPFNIVMVEYQPEGISSPGYLYYPASEIDFKSQYDSNNNADEIVKSLLNTIKAKKCKVCAKQATVLYISKEISPFKKYKTEPREEFADKGEYLCKKHTLEKVIPALKNTSKHFDTYGGLYVPYKEDGYQATIEW